MTADDPYSPRPLARWYRPAAIATLMLAALYCAGLVIHFTLDPQALPVDQRALYEAQPGWVFGLSVVMGLAGLAGGVLLVMRKASSVGALMVALIAGVLWLAATAMSPMWELMTQSDLVTMLLVVALVWTGFWFARHSRQRGWLR